ncbi:MAG: FtsX-like permease family protein [Gemmatimonadaceae bacterium]
MSARLGLSPIAGRELSSADRIGVRIALGASRKHILFGILRDGALLTAVGLVLGFALSAAAGTVLGNVLYGVTPTDPSTYLGRLHTARRSVARGLLYPSAACCTRRRPGQPAARVSGCLMRGRDRSRRARHL